MTVRTVGIIMNGVTGRMGTNQHLIRSIAAIREQGGVPLPDGDVLIPNPILVGRNENKLRALAQAHGIERWSTDLNECLANPEDEIYFDAQATTLRPESIKTAISAGKHIYCEKPIAPDLATAIELAQMARRAGVKNGVVQDKLFLPGLLKLQRVIKSGFFGRILSVRGEFGYWVFEGDWQPAQRPSWNYRKEEGGGIIVDMLCHWQYVLANLFGEVQAVSCLGATHIPDLLTIQVDGTEGSAVAGLRRCFTQSYAETPKPVWNPDIPQPIDFFAGWKEVPDEGHDNAFKVQWELFLKHVVCDTPFPWDLVAGAKGVQLAELGLQSWHERRWVDVPDLTSVTE
ncbi:MAG: Gfo/Idh/MocA family oxidoreductase [Chloroflexi bacterium]|nr:MAG: Gfo/Idh/MocA family oxidoreductase [Chloroflexota bacterium]